MLLSKLRWNQ